MKTRSGFCSLFLLITLPLVILSLKTLLYCLTRIEQQARLRHACIKQSLQLQKNLFLLSGNRDLFNKTSREKSLELLHELQKTNSAFRILQYPRFESEIIEKRNFRLVYQLKHQLTCGVRVIRSEDQWHYRSIYETSVGKF